MIVPGIGVTYDDIAAFCRKWRITRLELFGSALREDFRPDSDVDVLVTFDPDARWKLRDELDMEEELQRLFGRHVDFVERRLVETSPNWIRRRHILETARPIYAA